MKLRTAFYTLFIGAIVSPAAVYATTTISLQDFAVSVNGVSSDYNNFPAQDPTTLAGMNASGFSTLSTGDTANTGLGSLVYTFNPGSAGSYFVNFYFDHELSTPFENEFGTKVGSAPAGMSWEIAQLNPSVGGITFCCGSPQTFPNALDNTNHVPVGNTNYLNNCTTTPCNADVALALGFNFVLAAGQQAVITVNASTTNPGGFYLEQIHPTDPANPAETDLFLNGSISIQQAGGGGNVPEPGYWPVLGIALVAIAAMKLRRKALVG